ncbi:hypothetical protein RSOL_407900 [Rhizoctonia solani AG-3 Rhs1AP]|uniref:Transmembrane protein n=1 Tax=Rhizoctonia solani AG-3 Rhs1AP TaxID=1086054 RepID=X8JEV7_9AGAM|nr:hypothetical protein RSOL_407900 [Rhizoctonia solani AG-3 Rhs1AP]
MQRRRGLFGRTKRTRPRTSLLSLILSRLVRPGLASATLSIWKTPSPRRLLVLGRI